MIDVGTAAIAILPLLFIPIPQPERSISQDQGAASAGGSLFGEIRDGLRYVWNWTGLRTLIGMVLVANLFGVPALSFIPLLVTRYFGQGVLQVGWMGTVEGVGVLCGGLLLTAWGGFQKRVVTILLGAILQGVGVLLMGLAPADAFPLALAGNLLWTLARPVLDGTIFAMIQSYVPPELQGRVFSFMLSGAGASSLLGLTVAGPIVDRSGLPFWYILTGVVVILVGVSGFLIPSIMTLEQSRPGKPVPTVFEQIPGQVTYNDPTSE